MGTDRKFPCGTRARYESGCRCDDCRRAHREYTKAKRDKKRRKARVICKRAYCQNIAQTYGMCRRCAAGGAPNRRKVSNRWPMATGYVVLRMPDHPTSNSKGRIYEHRYVMEQMIGRGLELTESVHHRNGDRSDNRPENLELWASKAHPPGQRVIDLVAWAEEILRKYKPVTEVLRQHRPSG